MSIQVDVTLRRIVYELSQWADAHSMVNNFFGYGEFLQVTSEVERQYPAMVVNVTGAGSDSWYINYNFEVMFLQYVNDEQDNRKRAMSDTREYLNDLEETVRYSNRWQNFCRIDAPFNAVPAIEKGRDKSFGWIGTFTMRVRKRNGICNLQALMPEYDFQTGDIVGKTCAPSIFKNSNGTFEVEIASGETYTSSDITHSINGVAQDPIPSNVANDFDFDCPPSTIQVNGDEFTAVESGATLNIEVEYETSEDDPIDSVVGDKIIITDPVVIPTVRLYQKAVNSGTTTIYENGDTGWRAANDIGKLVQSEVGVMMRLEFGSQTTLQYTNIFGSYHRFTGLTGGYYNNSDSKYYNKLDVEVTRSEAFPSLIVVDHLTSDLWDGEPTSAFIRDWSEQIQYGLTRDVEGFEGWYLPSIPEFANVGNWGITFGYRDNLPFDWGNTLKLSGDSYHANPTLAMCPQPYNQITAVNKVNNNAAVFIKPIDINNDIVIT